ncbi:hypothetical protein WJR50_13595 [Catalinimonas sp. 4WD22]|uniref:hypothetical protein n=1 Tax=Catalinimonas locisalis TaxID=3133978 RepID=UPI003100F611
MNLASHCRICENQLYDIEVGTRCSLTNDRPSFREKCSEIRLEKKYENIIKEVNIEYELVRRTKLISYANFVFFLLVSVLLISAGYFFGKYGLEKGVISTVPLIIIGAGILVLPLASGPLNKYRQSIAVAKKKKEELDKVLALYNTKYTIEVIVNKDLHGNKEIDTKLTFLRKY